MSKKHLRTARTWSSMIVGVAFMSTSLFPAASLYADQEVTESLEPVVEVVEEVVVVEPSGSAVESESVEAVTTPESKESQEEPKNIPFSFNVDADNKLFKVEEETTDKSGQIDELDESTEEEHANEPRDNYFEVVGSIDDHIDDHGNGTTTGTSTPIITCNGCTGTSATTTPWSTSTPLTEDSDKVVVVLVSEQFKDGNEEGTTTPIITCNSCGPVLGTSTLATSTGGFADSGETLIGAVIEVVKDAAEEVSKAFEVIETGEVTFSSVVTGEAYSYPDSEFSITFSEISFVGEEAPTLTIREIELTEEEMDKYGALSPIAYEAISNMPNGSFLYDLTLPVPVEVAEDEVEVKFAQDTDALDVAEELEGETKVASNTVTITGIDHFTVFFITSGKTSTNSGQTSYNVAQVAALSTSDDSRVSKAWDETYGGNFYQEFVFSPNYPGTSNIVDVKLKFEVYREGNVNQLDVWSYDTADAQFEGFAGNSVLPASSGAGSETTFTITLPADHVDTVAELNAYKFRIYGKVSTTTSATDTFTDLVELVVTTSDKPTNTAPADGAIISVASEDYDLTWSTVAQATSYNFETCATDAGSSGCGTPLISATTTSAKYVVATSTAESIFWWHARAVFNDGTKSDWSTSTKATIDNTDPTDPTESSVTSGTHTVNGYSSDQTIDISWPAVGATGGASDTNGVSGFSYDFTNGATSTPDDIQDVASTTTSVTSGTLADGSWNFNMRTQDTAGNWTSTVHAGPFLIDVTAPTNPTLASTQATSVATSSNIIPVTWSGAADAGSGVAGFSFLWDTTATTLPDSTQDAASTTQSNTSSALADGSSHYFHIRTVDEVGNWSSTAAHIGPFFIDTTAPAVPTLVSPTDGAAQMPAGLTLDWGDVSDNSTPVTYNFQYGTSNSTTTNNALTSVTANSTGLTTSSFDASGLADGVYYWQAQGCDGLSQCSDWSGPWQVTVDGTAPTSPNSFVVDPAINTSQNDNTLQLTWPAEDALGGASDATSGIAGYSYSFTMGAADVPDILQDIASSTLTVTSNALADGNWYFHLRAIDRAGNSMTTSHIGPFIIDTVPPVPPTPLTPSDTTFSKGVAFTHTWSTPSDATRYRFQTCTVDPGDTGARCSGTASTTGGLRTASYSVAAGEPDGTQWWRVRARDAARNWSKFGASFKLVIDNTAPATTFTSPTTASNWNTAITISGATTDANNVDKVTLSYRETGAVSWTTLTELDNASNASPYNWSYTWTPNAEKNYEIRAQGTDVAGNQEGDTTVTDIDYDTTSPALNIIAPASNAHVSRALGFSANGTVSDSLSGVASVLVNWYKESSSTTLATSSAAAFGLGTWTRNFGSTDTLLVDGLWKMEVQALDAAGNVVLQESRNIQIDSIAPSITLTDPNPVTFEVHSAYVDPGYTATDDIDGDVTANVTTTSTVNMAVLGTYTVTYDVKDAAGNSARSVVRTVKVVDTTPPVITILGSNPTNLNPGGSYNEAGATALDNYDGDLTSSIVITGTVSAGTKGGYKITYTVTDSSRNTASVTRTVNVPGISGGTIAYGVGGSVIPSYGGGGGGSSSGGGLVLGASTDSASNPQNGSNVETSPFPVWSHQAGFQGSDKVPVLLNAYSSNGGTVLGASREARIEALKAQIALLQRKLIDLLAIQIQVLSAR